MNQPMLLNVDDHEPGRYARSRLLTEAGYTVEEAATGSDALRLAEKIRPALILLDVHLPDMSGLEVCRRVKAQADLAKTLVLHISATAITDPHRASGLNSGADAYLVEPVDTEVMLATVRALLRMRKAEEELEEANTALRESNAALEQVNAALRISNEDLQRFSYLASHDLQEPLRTIRSFAMLLDRRYRTRLDPTADEYLKHIEAAAARMSSLIKNLLAYAQLGQDNQNLENTVQTGEIVKLACANLEEALNESSAEIVYGALPAVRGDEVQLVQLFQNIIGNAVKYRSPDKKPHLIIQAEKRPDGSWLFAVADNGVGIPSQHLETIFDAFKRLHGKDVPGTGLGLATCRRIVERHGGRIWAESAGEGRGSTFRFTLQAG